MTPKTTEIDALETSISEAENAVNEYLSAGTVKDHMRNLIKAARSHLATLKAEPQDGDKAYHVNDIDVVETASNGVEAFNWLWTNFIGNSTRPLIAEGMANIVRRDLQSSALSRAAITPESEGIAGKGDSSDPEVIYLEPECCADLYTGRSWSSAKDWNECEEGFQPTKYIRADTLTRPQEIIDHLASSGRLK